MATADSTRRAAIGAIGVSGGSSPQDAQVAQAGIDALASILK